MTEHDSNIETEQCLVDDSSAEAEEMAIAAEALKDPAPALVEPPEAPAPAPRVEVALASQAPIALKQMKGVVDLARAEIGVREVPKGSNDGEPMKRYALHGEAPLAWCARFVRTMHSRAGHSLPGNQWEIGSVKALQKALEAVGAWHLVRSGYVPKPGDLVLLGAGAQSDVGVVGHHVGLVEFFDNGVVHSIDGNWGDAVCRVARVANRPRDEVWGYGSWPLV